jgi:hypothetical protein
MSTSKSSNALLLWLAAAAPLALGVAGVLVAAGVPPLRGWIWPAADTTMVEAAALGDSARLRALAAAGASLDARGAVRRDLVDRDVPTNMTPIEAAVRRRSDSMVQMLIELGARPSAAEARYLWCLATETDDPGTAELLAESFPEAAGDCEAQDAQGQLRSANE